MATVIEKISAEIRDAFFGRKPLVMTDTFEIGLAERAAVQAGVIEFAEKRTLPLNQSYYSLIEDDMTRYRESESFSVSPSDLDVLAKKGGCLLNERPDEPPVLPKLIILDILPSYETDALEKLFSSLRRYIRAYESCFDDYSALRSSLVVLTGDPSLLPEDVSLYTKIIDVPYPDIAELREMIPSEDAVDREDIAARLAGFTYMQARECISKLERLGITDSKAQRDRVIYEMKLQNLRRHGSLLTLYEPKPCTSQEENGLDESLGGMGNLKDYIKKIKKDLRSGAISITPSGVGHYKGILLVGVPGSGKSYLAGVLQQELGITMLRLDMERMMNSYVGESEKALQKALEQAEALSPCIVWIDELDKGLSGASSQSGDGGTFKRMFGHLLKWLSKEKQSPCFIYATANDITGFPAELFRSGRFDAVFGAYMPSAAECRDILLSLMAKAEKKREDDYKRLGKKPPCPLFTEDCKTQKTLDSLLLTAINPVPRDSDSVKKRPKFLTGADIEKIVKEAVKKIGPADAHPIDGRKWADTLSEIISDPFITTQGYSEEDLNKITACYVRILRSKAIPTGKTPMFDYEGYSASINASGTASAEYKGECPSKHEYDMALFREINKRLPSFASRIEQNAFLRECQ